MAERHSGSLERSMVWTTLVYLILQCMLFLVFSVAGSFLPRFFLPFFITATLFHTAIFVMLILFRADFYIEATGQRLQKINLANRITLFRITTLPTLLFLVMAAKEYRIRTPLLILVVVVFATDFLDGYISRKANQVTRIGRMMDSASDYCLITVLTIIFHYYSLVPPWMFWLVMGRLSLQTVLMAILIIVHNRIEPRSSPMGKVAVASIMILYSIEVLKLVGVFMLPTMITVLEYAAGAIILASVVDKLYIFITSLMGTIEDRRKDNTR